LEKASRHTHTHLCSVSGRAAGGDCDESEENVRESEGERDRQVTVKRAKCDVGLPKKLHGEEEE